jgi:hypothetical protein
MVNWIGISKIVSKEHSDFRSSPKTSGLAFLLLSIHSKEQKAGIPGTLAQRRALEMDGGDGCTVVVCMYLLPLNWILKVLLLWSIHLPQLKHKVPGHSWLTKPYSWQDYYRLTFPPLMDLTVSVPLDLWDRLRMKSSEATASMWRPCLTRGHDIIGHLLRGSTHGPGAGQCRGQKLAVFNRTAFLRGTVQPGWRQVLDGNVVPHCSQLIFSQTTSTRPPRW